jgi:hypothetical protein
MEKVIFNGLMDHITTGNLFMAKKRVGALLLFPMVIHMSDTGFQVNKKELEHY